MDLSCFADGPSSNAELGKRDVIAAERDEDAGAEDHLGRSRQSSTRRFKCKSIR